MARPRENGDKLAEHKPWRNSEGRPRRTNRGDDMRCLKCNKVVSNNKRYCIDCYILEAQFMPYTKIDYKEYLTSEHWKLLKEKKFSRKRNKKCALCGSIKNLDVHHLRYYDLLKVRCCDLRVLCRDCHKTTHGLLNEGELRKGSIGKKQKQRLVK